MKRKKSVTVLTVFAKSEKESKVSRSYIQCQAGRPPEVVQCSVQGETIWSSAEIMLGNGMCYRTEQNTLEYRSS